LPGGQPLATIKTHHSGSHLLRASPDFRTVAVGTFQDVDLYDVGSQKVRLSLLDHRGQVNKVAFTSDSATLVVASSRLDAANREFTNVKLWDCATGKALASLPETRHSASALWVDADAKRILLETTAYYDQRQKRLQAFDRRSEKWVTLECRNDKCSEPTCAAADSSLTRVAAGFGDGSIRVYDLSWPATK
jgi:WD40 repeat protein